jgi:Protein of unknown function (DUF664)
VAAPAAPVRGRASLHCSLREVREVLLWKLDGLSEHDIRRPLTLTGTNLLGLVKPRWESIGPPGR